MPGLSDRLVPDLFHGRVERRRQTVDGVLVVFNDIDQFHDFVVLRGFFLKGKYTH